MNMTLLKKSIITMSTALLLTGQPAASQDMQAALKAIDDALPGKLIHNPLAIEWESKGDDKKVKVVKAETPNGQALSARVKKRKQRPWDVTVGFDLEDAVKSGDQVEVHFWARTEKAAKGNETAEFVVFLGRNEEPYDYIISSDLAPDENWKLHTLKSIAKSDFSAGEVKFEYQIGQHAQTIEFGPVYVSNLGPASN